MVVTNYLVTGMILQVGPPEVSGQKPFTLRPWPSGMLEQLQRDLEDRCIAKKFRKVANINAYLAYLITLYWQILLVLVRGWI